MNTTPILTYIGHATLLIEIDGVRLLTDPILRSRVLHLRRRDIPIDPVWYQNIDAVLISHNHWDHLDFPSLGLLKKSTRMLVPTGTARILQRHGFSAVEELAVGEYSQVGSIQVQATYANHGGGRDYFGRPGNCMGFLIHGSCGVYFAGDTDIFPEMADLAPGIDLALLPVWGWGPTLGQGHMSPHQAASALQLLKPHLAVPIHWGALYPLGIGFTNPDFLIDPPHAFARVAARLAPEVKVKIISPGVSFSATQC